MSDAQLLPVYKVGCSGRNGINDIMFIYSSFYSKLCLINTTGICITASQNTLEGTVSYIKYGKFSDIF
jgi:hypothetical protein